MLNEKGEIEVRYTESVAVWEPHQRMKTFQVRDGDNWRSVSETTAYKVRIHQTKAATESRPAGHYRVFRNGTELDEKTRNELLKQPRRVVFLESRQSGANSPNEFYLDLLANDTLVVLLDILKTPEVKAEPAKLPSLPASRPPMSPEEQTGSDGIYWPERLSLVVNEAAAPGHASKRLEPMLDPQLDVLYVLWRKRPDVAQSGWGGPQLVGQDSELTWFGHRTGDRPGKPATISFGVNEYEPGKAERRVPRYLSVINVKTKPELTLTKDRDKASLWSLSAEKSWIDKSRDITSVRTFW